MNIFVPLALDLVLLCIMKRLDKRLYVFFMFNINIMYTSFLSYVKIYVISMHLI